jgi:hypothetical protein
MKLQERYVDVAADSKPALLNLAPAKIEATGAAKAGA